jgi:hypothetical protein
MSKDEDTFPKPRPPRRWPLAALACLAILVGLYLFLPGYLLGRLLNQDFSDEASLVSGIRTDKINLSPLLDRITLSGVTMFIRQQPGHPVRIREARVSGLSKVELLKTIFGLGDDSFTLLSEGELIIRDLANGTPFEGRLENIHVGAFSLEGFSIVPGETARTRLDHVAFRSLRLSDFRASLSDGSSFEVQGLSLFGLRDSVLGGLVVGDLALGIPDAMVVKGLALGNASVSGLDLMALTTGLVQAREGLLAGNGLRTAVGAGHLAESFGSLDLASLSWTGEGGELFFLGRALVDDLPAEDGQEPSRLWSLEDLSADLDGLAPILPKDPLALAFLDCLAPEATASFEARSGHGEAGYGSQIRLKVAEKIDVSLNMTVKNLPKGLNGQNIIMALPALSFGPGELELTGRPFLGDLKASLGRRLLGGQDFEPAAGQALSAFLSGLADPTPGGRALNQEILEAELARFLEDPGSLRLSWDPIRGFPSSVLSHVEGGLPTLLGEIGSGNGGRLAGKYGYAIIMDLNMSLEVNGRAPVAVYLGPPGDPASEAD